MIHPVIIREVKQLLANGQLSHRKIAAKVGVSRGTVGAVARGVRDERWPKKSDVWETTHGPAQRCPSCGARVYMPCRLCKVRAAVARERESAKRRRQLIADFSRLPGRDGHAHWPRGK